MRQRSNRRQASGSVQTECQTNTLVEIRNEDVAIYLTTHQRVLPKFDRYSRDTSLESKQLAGYSAGEVCAVPLQREIGLTDLAAETTCAEKDVVHSNCTNSGRELWNLDDDV